jgi:hypothetical protein
MGVGDGMGDGAVGGEGVASGIRVAVITAGGVLNSIVILGSLCGSDAEYTRAAIAKNAIDKTIDPNTPMTPHGTRRLRSLWLACDG